MFMQELDLTVVVARLRKENEELKAKLALGAHSDAVMMGVAPSGRSGLAAANVATASLESKSAAASAAFRELSQAEIAKCEERVVSYLHFNPGACR